MLPHLLSTELGHLSSLASPNRSIVLMLSSTKGKTLARTALKFAAAPRKRKGTHSTSIQEKESHRAKAPNDPSTSKIGKK